MSYERIDESEVFDGKVRDEHESRYRIASGFTESEDTILDAGCGIGYSFKFFDKPYQAYIGIDRNPPDRPIFLKADFETGEGLTDERCKEFDVFVGLEIIEHLDNVGVDNFIALANEARKWVIISTPIVPNSNPFHKQKFSEEDIMKLCLEKLTNFRHYQTFYQDRHSMYREKYRYGIFIFKRV